MRWPRIARGDDLPWWLARLRWTLRGESALIGFVAAVIVDALLLTLLPVRGDGGPFTRALLVGIALNLVLVVVGGAIGARLLRRRDPSLPRLVARDRAATYAMLAGIVVVCLAGIVHRPAVTAERDKIADVIATARGLAKRTAPAVVREHLDRIDVRRLTTNVYRACFSLGQPDRAWCAIVRRDGPDFRARHDLDTRPNDKAGGVAGPAPVELREP